ncbi:MULTISPECIES: hypothetical protein [unclassified Streptomyces]|uniref:hypothetical protein n=1 Tax=unclassified Streptomyces TaxID=2593676 RepID=UPI00035E5982|nr:MULTISPECIES: hypothetical protein [unclassified Streptomyces]MYT28945.1 hypothetical protein [Streptomyces sp. SID8354]
MTPARPTHHHPAHPLRRELPSTAAVLADARDFAAMRRYRTFPFDDHRGYLRQLETLLRTLAAQGVHTTLCLFDPAAFARYCADHGLDPDAPASRSRYTAAVACTGASLAYDGTPLEHLLPLLTEEAARRESCDRATTLLARAGRCATCGEDLAHAAFTRATTALHHLLAALGAGTHHLVCTLPDPTGSLRAYLHTTATPDGTPADLPASETLAFCTVLAAALVQPVTGALVCRTLPATEDPSRPTDPSDPGPALDPGPATVRGWRLRGAWPDPISAAEIFDAYCTDPETDEPIPPEHRVDYAPGLPLPPPPAPHCHP